MENRKLSEGKLLSVSVNYHFFVSIYLKEWIVLLKSTFKLKFLEECKKTIIRFELKNENFYLQFEVKYA